MNQYTLDSKFNISREEAPGFRMIEQLLASGEKIPVFMSSMKIGAGVSCSVEDDRYWAFDFGKTEVEKSPTLSLQMRFELDMVANLELYDVYINPVCHEVVDDKGKPSFSILLFFDVKLAYKPALTPPGL